MVLARRQQLVKLQEITGQPRRLDAQLHRLVICMQQIQPGNELAQIEHRLAQAGAGRDGKITRPQ